MNNTIHVVKNNDNNFKITLPLHYQNNADIITVDLTKDQIERLLIEIQKALFYPHS